MQKIQRKSELDKLFVLKDKNLIKVVTGVRRAWKSTLLLQFQELLKAENPNVSLVPINMDLPEFRFLAEKNWKEIYDYIKNLLQENATNYVFIDEVQNIPEFENIDILIFNEKQAIIVENKIFAGDQTEISQTNVEDIASAENIPF